MISFPVLCYGCFHFLPSVLSFGLNSFTINIKWNNKPYIPIGIFQRSQEISQVKYHEIEQQHNLVTILELFYKWRENLRNPQFTRTTWNNENIWESMENWFKAQIE